MRDFRTAQEFLRIPTSERYSFSRAWSGTAKLVGQVAKRGATSAINPEQKVSIDCCLHATNSFLGFGPTVIGSRSGNDAVTDLYTYMPSLPDSKRISVCVGLSALEHLLGVSHIPQCTWSSSAEWHATQEWRFFSIKNSTTIEVLIVHSRVSRATWSSEWVVDSIAMWTGDARRSK